MNAQLKVLIVDDEINAREGLRALLSEEADVVIVGECGDGATAVADIRRLQPDLVFLDIEMPERNGLEVVAEVGPANMPPVVFVTAYDEYAIAAFEASAIDYLLKPFTDERFQTTMQRVREHLSRNDRVALADQLTQLVGQHAGGVVERFTVRVGDALHVFEVDEIDWIEAHEYYAKLHIGGEAHLVRQTMGALEDRLPPSKFVRIHRSTIVNVSRVKVLEPLFQGDFNVVLKDGTRLRMSRRRRDLIGERMPNFS